MAKGINLVVLTGRLGADPELRHSQSGTAVVNLRLAIPMSVKNASGDWEERTEWVPCVAFGKRAEVLSQYARKGSLLTITGSLRSRSWEKDDGSKGYATEVLVEDFVLPPLNGYDPHEDHEPPKPSERPKRGRKTADGVPF